MAACPTLRTPEGSDSGCGIEVLNALAAVIRLFPEGSVQAASAVISAGVVPALVDVIRTFTQSLEPLPPPQHFQAPPKLPKLPRASEKHVNAEHAQISDGTCHCGQGSHAVTGSDSIPSGIATSSGRNGSGGINGGSSNKGIAASDNDAITSCNLHRIASSAWDAFDVLETLIVFPLLPPHTPPAPAEAGDKTTSVLDAAAALQKSIDSFHAMLTRTAATNVANVGTCHALDSGAIQALLPLLNLPSQTRGDHSWRALRILLVLQNYSMPQGGFTAPIAAKGTSNVSEQPNTIHTVADSVDDGGGGGGGAPSCKIFFQAFSFAMPESIKGLLGSVHDLLAAPHALSDNTAETLLVICTELLSHGSLHVDQLRRYAPALVEAATGILTGTSPAPSWRALLPCALERNLQRRTHGSVRFSIQLEAAAARLASELLGWALAQEEEGEGKEVEGEEGSGSWRSWLRVTSLAAAMMQRWLDRPGAFEALGEAGISCLTLSLQLAPPGELWTCELIWEIPQLARKVRAMVERHKYIAVWQLALVSAVSAFVGSRLLLSQTPHNQHPPASSSSCSSSSPSYPAPLASSSTDSNNSNAQQQQQQQEPHSDGPSPQVAAQDLMAYLAICMRTVKLAKLPPVERIGIVAGALNAVMACVAPQRVVTSHSGGSARGGTVIDRRRRHHRRQKQELLLLLPSLAQMQLLPSPLPPPPRPAPPEAHKEHEKEEEEEEEHKSVVGTPAECVVTVEACRAGQQQQLLGAMTTTLARLNLLLADAMEAAATADDDQDSGADPSPDDGDKGGDDDEENEDEDEDEASSDGGSGEVEEEEEDLNGSFHGVDIQEMKSVMAVALRVAANAAAVLRQLGFPLADC